MDWNAEVVDQLESHWHEQLRPRLDGLSDDEYFWEPVPGCWSVRPSGTGFTWDFGPPQDPEPVTTIAWRLAHLVVGLRDADPATFAYAGTAAEALQQLDDAYASWVAQVRALGEAGLARPQGPSAPPAYADLPVARVVLYTSAEVIHHGAEVCLLRDLYLRLAG